MNCIPLFLAVPVQDEHLAVLAQAPDAKDAVHALVQDSTLVGLLSSRPADGMCYIRTNAINAVLRRLGYSPKILEGTLKEKDGWLEHRVALLQFEKFWVVFDGAISQFAEHSTADLLVLVSDPDWAALEHCIRQHYRWWLPGDQ